MVMSELKQNQRAVLQQRKAQHKATLAKIKERLDQRVQQALQELKATSELPAPQLRAALATQRVALKQQCREIIAVQRDKFSEEIQALQAKQRNARAQQHIQTKLTTVGTRVLSLRISVAVLHRMRLRVRQNGETAATFASRAVERLRADFLDRQVLEVQRPSTVWWQGERRMWTVHLACQVVDTIEQLAPRLCCTTTSWLQFALIRELEFGQDAIPAN
jgi:hypothetical protein